MYGMLITDSEGHQYSYDDVVEHDVHVENDITTVMVVMSNGEVDVIEGVARSISFPLSDRYVAGG